MAPAAPALMVWVMTVVTPPRSDPASTAEVVEAGFRLEPQPAPTGEKVVRAEEERASDTARRDLQRRPRRVRVVTEA